MIIEGKVQFLPIEKISKNKKAYVYFTVSTGRQNISKLLAFEPLKDKLLKEKMTIDEPIRAECKLMEGSTKDDVLSYVIQSYTFPDRKEENKKQEKRDIERAANKTLFLKNKQEMENKGFKWVLKDGRGYWKHESDCIFYNNAWHDKLEFCMDQWGGERVTQCLKDDALSFSEICKHSIVKEKINNILLLVLADLNTQRMQG